MSRRALPAFAVLLTLAGPAVAGGAGLGGASCPQLYDSYEPPEPVLDDKVVLTADRVLLEKDGLSKLAGAVRLRQGGKEFTAQALDYDDVARRVQVNAESLFRNRQFTIRSQRSAFDLDAEAGSFDDTEFTLAQRAARGTSKRITLARAGSAGFEQVSYTTCSPESRAWYLQASEIHLDVNEGLGTAKHARLRFMGVPILYAPWFQFPIDDRRRTGLLFPTIGDSDTTGLDIRQPIYFNLAPNYDATLTPRYMSARGVQITNDFRYLLPRSEGKASYEYLSEDRATGERRDFSLFQHQGLVGRRMEAQMRYAEASDSAYFEDLGGKIDISSITHLERSARLTYQAPAAYTIQGMIQDYQTISRNLTPADEPYRRLPYIRGEALTRNSILDTRLGIDGEYTNFQRKDSVEGQRLGIRPFLRMQRDRVAWFVGSQLDFNYTTYQLNETLPGQPNDAERALPVFSAEGGLRFERITGSGRLQTMQPHLFYLYVPYDNQDDLPVFDSGEPDFEFTQLFARNRFSGEDRVSDANHLAAAVTARELDPVSGTTRVAASVGQLFRFEAPAVQLPGQAGPASGATDFIASLQYAVAASWSASFAAQWSPEERQFNRTSFGLHFRDEQHRLDLGYRYRSERLEQADLTASTPVLSQWRLAGRWRYSLRNSKSLDTLAGVEYETCCWAVRTSYRRYIANADGDYNSGVYLQLELKGLTRIGSGFPGLQPAEQEAY